MSGDRDGVRSVGGGDDGPWIDAPMVDVPAAASDSARRHLAELGAEMVGEFERWLWIRTPGGPLACLVPDAAG